MHAACRVTPSCRQLSTSLRPTRPAVSVAARRRHGEQGQHRPGRERQREQAAVAVRRVVPRDGLQQQLRRRAAGLRGDAGADAGGHGGDRHGAAAAVAAAGLQQLQPARQPAVSRGSGWPGAWDRE